MPLRQACRRLTLVAPTGDEYLQLTEASAAAGLAGGAIYDALLAECALKADAEVIYTWNTNDFRRLRPSIAGRVQLPGA